METKLLLLYQTVLVPILSEWIQCEDLCACDTAVCNNKLRNTFLATLSRCKINPTNTQDTYEWIDLRNMSLKSVVIPCVDAVKPSKTLLKLLSRSKSLNSLEAEPCSQLANLIKVLQLSVRTLVLKSESTDGAILSILSALRGCITGLVLSDGLSRRLYSQIRVFCPHLETLLGPNDSSIISILQSREFTDFNVNDTRHSGNLSFGPFDVSSVNVSGMKYTLRSLTLQCDFFSSSDSAVVLPLAMSIESLTLNLPKLGTLTPTIVSFMVSCLNLTDICAHYIRFDESVLIEWFKKASKLSSFVFNCCEGISDSLVLRLAEFGRPLTSFACYSTGASEQTLCKLLDVCDNIEIAALHKCQPVLNGHLMLRHAAAALDSLFIQNSTRFCIQKKCVRNFSYHLSCMVDSVGGNALWLIFKNCPALRRVAIDNQEGCTDQVVEVLVQLCPLLSCVTFQACPISEAVFSILAPCSHLTSLRLACIKTMSVTTSSLLMLLRDKPHFVKLALPVCKGITAECLIIIASCCPAIRYVDIRRSSDVRSSDVINLLNCCPRIDSLDVASCEVDSEILNCLSSRKMTHLNVENTGITKSDIGKLIAGGFSCSKIIY